MIYKLIGTEQDLIDNGYKLSVFADIIGNVYYKRVGYIELRINVDTNEVRYNHPFKNILEELDRLVEKGVLVKE